MAKNITKIKHRFPLKQLRLIAKNLSHIWPVYSLIFITSLLIFLNFEPGTYLTGWDNLHPEFDISENLRRTVFSVWQEYRGLGLLGGMAHAADLPRTLFVALLLALKTAPNLIRYLTTFIPLVLGPLGVYTLFYHHLFRNKLDSKTTQFASFLGALYYLLNLNTLQTFFVPFETFTSFYGALPWLVFFLISYLQKPNLKRLFVLFFVSFLSAPSFYVETIFLVFFVSILPFFVEFVSRQQNKLAHLKTSLSATASLIIPHLFWLLPVSFFVLTQGHVAEQAKNNLLSSPETYARNLQFANFRDLALIKGYLFNYLDLGPDQKYTYLLSVWRNHLRIPLVNLLGYTSFVLVLTGLYYSFKKRFTWTKSFLGVLALCFFFLLGGGLLINQKIPFIGELFRSPFTKFSITLSFAYAFFFSIGTIFLLDLFTFLHSRLTYYLTLFTVAFSLIVFMSPAFSGNLISPSMRRTIPEEYFSLFSYLKTQDPASRVASFPQFSFWGWLSYDWGYRGSGFLWYGIRQPLLDRAFDVWDKNNERYYEEMSTALYSANADDFASVLDKYAVDWLIIDHHVTLPNQASDSGLVTLKTFLSDISKYSLVQNFNNQIELYRVSPPDDRQNFLSLTNTTSVTRPFADLSLRPSTAWTQKGEYLNLTIPVNTPAGTTLTLPSLTQSEYLLPTKIDYRKNSGSLDLRLTPLTPTIFLNSTQLDIPVRPLYLSIPSTIGTGFVLELDGSYFELQLPAEIDSFSDYYPLTTTYLPSNQVFSLSLYSSTADRSINLTNSLSAAEPQQCYLKKPNRKIEKIITPHGVSLLGTDVVGCLSTSLPLSPRGSLFSLSFTYLSPTLTTANVSISGKDYGAQNLPQPLDSQSKPTGARVFAPSIGSAQQANLVLEASESLSVREIEYQNIELDILPRLFSASLGFPSIPGQTHILQGDLNRLQVSLPETDTPYDIKQTPLKNTLLPENRNCDQFNQGETVKIVTEEGFLYQSQNSIECDTLNLRHLPHSLNYLLSFDLEAQKGLAPTICFENHSSRRCDVQERLSDTDKTQTIIQPVRNLQEAPGYSLHLYNQSLGTRITSNLLKSISIRPIPLGFLSQISLSSPSAPKTGSDSSITSSKHPYPFIYLLQTNTSTESKLNLFQTRSSSWKAVKLASGDLQIPHWLLSSALLITAPILPQISPTTENLWHNSWNLPSGNQNLALVYLPQALEHLGLFFLVAFPLALFVYHLKKAPQQG